MDGTAGPRDGLRGRGFSHGIPGPRESGLNSELSGCIVPRCDFECRPTRRGNAHSSKCRRKSKIPLLLGMACWPSLELGGCRFSPACAHWHCSCNPTCSQQLQGVPGMSSR